MHSARIKAALFVLATSSSFSTFADEDLPIFAIDQAPELSDYSGFLLLKLASESDSATVQLSQLKTKKDQHYLSANEDIRKYRTDYRLSLKDKEPGYYLVPMKAGLYHIERIDAPLYNLPYKLSLKNIPGWRVSIAPAQTNYIGLLTIEKERTVDSMTVSLTPRYATDYQEITSSYSNLLTTYPLRNGAGYEDHFAASISNNQEQGAKQ